MSADCRVRKLQIRTQDEALLPRMTFVLEDALRTASFPGIPPNGIVYIRRLDLGKNVASVSSRVLSQRIDDLLRHILLVQVTENASDHLTVPAVWFADELEPYRILIGLLSKNHLPLAWYWPTAVKGWSPKLSLKQSYRLIISSVSQHSTGIRGMSHVLEPLFNTKTFLDMLTMFDHKEVSHWLFNLGLKPTLELRVPIEKDDRAHDSVGFNSGCSPLEVSRYWEDSIRKAVKMWSVFDPRTLLTSYLALTNVGHVPSPMQVTRLFDAVAKLENDGQRLDSQEKRKQSPRQMKRALVRRPAEEGNQPQLLDEGAADQFQTIQNDHKESSGTEKQDAQKSLFVHAGQRLDSQEKRKQSPGQMKRALVRRPVEEGNQPQLGNLGAADQFQTIQNDHKESTGKEKQDELTGVEVDNTVTPFQEPPWPEHWPLFSGFAGELSRYAGLLFLVRVIKKLGIESLLANYPNYLELQFAERILWRVAELLRIPSNDPSHYFLGEKPDTPTQQIEFVAPVHWRSILAPSSSKNMSFRVCRVSGMPGKRLILDNKGRLIVGLWHPQNTQQVHPWLEFSQAPLKRMAPRIWSLESAVDNFVLAMCCYVRRYAKMSLRSLVQRPAYIASTKTHLDVTIPFDQLDIRIRMAGLDINPGWVPWLGRVVQFHYLENEG